MYVEDWWSLVSPVHLYTALRLSRYCLFISFSSSPPSSSFLVFSADYFSVSVSFLLLLLLSLSPPLLPKSWVWQAVEKTLQMTQKETVVQKQAEMDRWGSELEQMKQVHANCPLTAHYRCAGCALTALVVHCLRTDCTDCTLSTH